MTSARVTAVELCNGRMRGRDTIASGVTLGTRVSAHTVSVKQFGVTFFAMYVRRAGVPEDRKAAAVPLSLCPLRGPDE